MKTTCLIGLLCLGGLPPSPQALRAGEPVVYDTVSPLAGPLSGLTLRSRSGWKTAEGPIAGDAVIENERIAVHARRNSGGLFLTYKLGAEARPGAEAAACVSGHRAVRFSRIARETPGSGGAALVVEGSTDDGKPVSFRLLLKGDEPIVEVRPGPGVSSLRIDHQSLHALLP